MTIDEYVKPNQPGLEYVKPDLAPEPEFVARRSPGGAALDSLRYRLPAARRGGRRTVSTSRRLAGVMLAGGAALGIVLIVLSQVTPGVLPRWTPCGVRWLTPHQTFRTPTELAPRLESAIASGDPCKLAVLRPGQVAAEDGFTWVLETAARHGGIGVTADWSELTLRAPNGDVLGRATMRWYDAHQDPLHGRHVHMDRFTPVGSRP